MAGPTTDTVTYGPVTYHTRVGVGRLGEVVWLELRGGQDGMDWEQRAFGALSPAKARELAAKLLIEAARIEGDLDGAEAESRSVITTEPRADPVGTPPSGPRRLP